MARNTQEQQENYRALAFSLILIGVLILIDRLIGFSDPGAGWIMRRTNFLLYIGAIFLVVKKDKSIGLILGGIWIVLNLGKVFALLGSLSAYVLPVALLAGGVLFYILSRKK